MRPLSCLTQKKICISSPRNWKSISTLDAPLCPLECVVKPFFVSSWLSEQFMKVLLTVLLSSRPRVKLLKQFPWFSSFFWSHESLLTVLSSSWSRANLLWQYSCFLPFLHIVSWLSTCFPALLKTSHTFTAFLLPLDRTNLLIVIFSSCWNGKLFKWSSYSSFLLWNGSLVHLEKP